MNNDQAAHDDPADPPTLKTNVWRVGVWLLWGVAMAIVATIIFGQ